jgi:uncharacterized protein YmfQ (DUF2313 family)
MSDSQVVTEDLLKPVSEQINYDLLLKHLPSGRLLEAAYNPDKNLGKLIYALSLEFLKIQSFVEKYTTETYIRDTIDLLENWERSLGVPSECFSTADMTIAERRIIAELIFGKFQGVRDDEDIDLYREFNGAQTLEDFERIAQLFGYNIEIESKNINQFPAEFPIEFTENIVDLAHTLYIYIEEGATEDYYFPLEFPIQFSEGTSKFLKCLFEIIAPANVQVIIRSN